MPYRRLMYSGPYFVPHFMQRMTRSSSLATLVLFNVSTILCSRPIRPRDHFFANRLTAFSSATLRSWQTADGTDSHTHRFVPVVQCANQFPRYVHRRSLQYDRHAQWSKGDGQSPAWYVLSSTHQAQPAQRVPIPNPAPKSLRQESESAHPCRSHAQSPDADADHRTNDHRYHRSWSGILSAN